MAARFPRGCPAPRTAAAVLSAMLATTLPVVALACPQCADRADGGIAQFLALGVFVTLPFAVVAVVARIVKRGDGTRPSADVAGSPPARRTST